MYNLLPIKYLTILFMSILNTRTCKLHVGLYDLTKIVMIQFKVVLKQISTCMALGVMDCVLMQCTPSTQLHCM